LKRSNTLALMVADPRMAGCDGVLRTRPPLEADRDAADYRKIHRRNARISAGIVHDSRGR
jgi:hypothetical protein